MDPFSIFPILAWEEILNRVKNPLDKLNTIKTNRRFELLELFQENKTEWKFSAILGILLEHRYLKNPNLQKSWLPEDELNLAVLNCRLVSKGTKRIVDNLVELYWEKYCWIPPFTPPVRLRNLEKIESCLSRAEQLGSATRSSPFIGGGVFYLHYGDGVNNFELGFPSLDTIAQLLSHPNIGVNLRGIRLCIFLSRDDLQGIRNFVRRLVQAIPNVIILSITFNPVANELVGEERPVATLTELPHLKHLELYDYIRTEGTYFLQNYFEFSGYFEQLTCLEMTLPFWKEHYNGQVVFLQLKTLLFTNVALCGQERIILDIIQNLNAPALERFTLETMVFNLFQFKHENLSLATFLREEVLGAISGVRTGQRWHLDRTYNKNPTNPQFVGWLNVFKVSTQKESKPQ